MALLLISLIIVICIAAGKLSYKLGLPSLLMFIVLGMLFGSDGIFKIPFDDYTFAEQICSYALIIIMFYRRLRHKLEASQARSGKGYSSFHIGGCGHGCSYRPFLPSGFGL